MPLNDETGGDDSTALIMMGQQLESLYQALLKVPRATGDHTDLCRMHNRGLSPASDEQCRCHVGPVRAALARYRLWKDG
ncbi:MAG: hypothetical protein HQL76_11135 [Magnetococcales bacterium]|nr:hypothetical protein [Magnetococcales bacterium]